MAEVSLEEVQRIHALANAQGTEFLFHTLERAEDNTLTVYLKGIIKDDQLSAKDAEAIKKGEYNATIQVPLPPEELFANRSHKGSSVNKTLNEKQYIYMLDHMEYPEEGGIYRHLKGMKYPEKGFPTPEIVTAANFVKRILATQVRFFAKNPLAAASFVFTRTFKVWVEEFNELCRLMLEPYYWEDKRYAIPCKEIWKFVRVFAAELKVGDVQADLLGRNFCHMIESDTAYRLRVEDLATVTNQEELLNHPRRAFQKVLVALAERDNRAHMVARFKAFAFLLSVALWIPKYRRAYRKAIQAIDFTKIQMDDADRYHTLRMAGYNFGGRKIEDRIQEFIKIHDGVLPPGYEINVNV